MEVITIEKIAYQELVHKLNTLTSLLKKGAPLEHNGFTWIDNTQFCSMLNITRRTAQKYRA